MALAGGVLHWFEAQEMARLGFAVVFGIGALGRLYSLWQLSGITQLQSGANITEGGAYNSSTNYHMSLTCVSSDTVNFPCPQSAAIIPGSISGAIAAKPAAAGHEPAAYPVPLPPLTRVAWRRRA